MPNAAHAQCSSWVPLFSVCRPSDAQEGSLVLRVESGDQRVKAQAWKALLHVSAGWDPFKLIEHGAPILLAFLSLLQHLL